MKEYYIRRDSALETLTEFLREEEHAILLNNTFEGGKKEFDFLAGAGISKTITAWDEKAVSEFINEAAERGQYIFCHFTYSLKDRFENLASRHARRFNWPEVNLFIPRTWFRIHNDSVLIDSVAGNDDEVYEKLLHSKPSAGINNDIVAEPTIAIDDYIHSVENIQQHIQNGDIYEMNYCFEFAGRGIIDPYSTWLTLAHSSPAPFSCFYRHKDNFLLCSSPERFIRRLDNKLISQPIKGTAARGRTREEDELSKNHLLSNEKELSENVMIVDLVRNDISRFAEPASVTVDELCGIYTFPAVHQLISTVSGRIRKETPFTEIIKAMFPMGSMTGAPKISAMTLIDRFENFNREIYSGSVGYIAPDGNFDLNVVIRSIIYNDKKRQLAIPVGSAITASSDPESEYRECLLKARSLLDCIK